MKIYVRLEEIWIFFSRERKKEVNLIRGLAIRGVSVISFELTIERTRQQSLGVVLVGKRVKEFKV